MTGMLLYCSLALMVLTVLSNRYWRRQLAQSRVAAAKLKGKADDLAVELTEISNEYTKLAQAEADMERRVTKAEQEMQAALIDLDNKRVAPLERYFVFERVDPRPGRFWEAAVRYTPAGVNLLDAGDHRGWTGVRRYLLVADTEREVRDRIGSRFPRKAGFEVIEVAACRLNGLVVNRISELSTFRRPGRPEEEEEGGRTTRRPAPAPARG
ncbi:hypothetical protein [Azospirillum thermophilum]|uniref:Uncharacterized protein n=1 Tax=Azospirillum thermophilum TaxID=2202148 RepID=A0A2S2CMR0_9PROT|nr:hypothetical protein [Azospirillum thermophilum]AWK85719.1 hypothetical protein DEW08_05665 [Azospirillum thermophilum]